MTCLFVAGGVAGNGLKGSYLAHIVGMRSELVQTRNGRRNDELP